jgi:hypothetical protein
MAISVPETQVRNIQNRSPQPTLTPAQLQVLGAAARAKGSPLTQEEADKALGRETVVTIHTTEDEHGFPIQFKEESTITK